ncbi:putative 2-haloacrylate reductase [Helianthus debilis subsp. tardiflorus]
MVKAIRVYEYGGVEVMKWEDVELGEPKSGEIKVKNKTIGVNYTDVYARRGAAESFNVPLPFTPDPLEGCEATGVVTVVGPEVTTCKVGDMVALAAGWHTPAYAEEMVLSSDRVVAVPPSIDPIVAAAAIFKGLTAEVLVRRCFKVGPGHTILYHATAGGVGSLACQWANALGATVIGTVSTKEKAVLAKVDGCHHVIIHKEENFVDRVMEITSGKGVDVYMTLLGRTISGESGNVTIQTYILNNILPLYIM